MTDAATTISLSAAFVAGIVGSAHCFGMCGGLAGALGMRARSTAAVSATAFGNAILYHAGRLGGYALAGAISGTIGATLQSVLDLARLGPLLRIASGALVVLVAMRILLPWNPLRWLEALGAHFWRQLHPLAQSSAKLGGPGSALALGFLWGWLPCGLVYSMLLFAALSTNAFAGAALLLTFGLGTLPSMLTSSLLASAVQRLLSRRWPRFASGVLLLLFGAWMVYASLPNSGHAHH